MESIDTIIDDIKKEMLWGIICTKCGGNPRILSIKKTNMYPDPSLGGDVYLVQCRECGYTWEVYKEK